MSGAVVQALAVLIIMKINSVRTETMGVDGFMANLKIGQMKMVLTPLMLAVRVNPVRTMMIGSVEVKPVKLSTVLLAVLIIINKHIVRTETMGVDGNTRILAQSKAGQMQMVFTPLMLAVRANLTAHRPTAHRRSHV